MFGPILHVVRFSGGHLDKVIDAINATGYGLTLGLHSRIAAVADLVAERARVGNLYVNRNQIGAVVGVQPFGGEGLSGTGPKAGGPHYLARFATERVRTTDITATGGNVGLQAGLTRRHVGCVKRNDGAAQVAAQTAGSSLQLDPALYRPAVSGSRLHGPSDRHRTAHGRMDAGAHSGYDHCRPRLISSSPPTTSASAAPWYQASRSPISEIASAGRVDGRQADRRRRQHRPVAHQRERVAEERADAGHEHQERRATAAWRA